jgi:hypothetical protein
MNLMTRERTGSLRANLQTFRLNSEMPVGWRAMGRTVSHAHPEHSHETTCLPDMDPDGTASGRFVISLGTGDGICYACPRSYTGECNCRYIAGLGSFPCKQNKQLSSLELFIGCKV